MNCGICGTELKPEEEVSGICYNCQSIIATKDVMDMLK
jgi:hypothetical protein